ncbi:hydrolase activity, acting on glycosyl bonds [Nesidiocoris tenuis]|uniref:Hydrolase activity, acting on glycosyl bonds n=1 Tax=Nesidiocoris tenuis TaxID=355587 RepID=A0ABN7AT56_9HEMI|nr:hydrolase activity, acting on glycosyl bonds [Nesidiocoris tenuis]
MDGRSIPSRIRQSCGGVGRNIADSLGKLRPVDSHRPSTRLISAVGDDSFGNIVLNSISHLDSSGVSVVENGRTASYCALVDSNGDAKIGAGDMEILSSIRPDLVTDLAITDSDFLVLDGNVPHETIEAVLSLSNEHNIPVWFEPTDILKASKPFGTDLWKCITCTSPNMNELKAMAGAAGLPFDEQFNFEDDTALIKQLVYLSQPLCEHIPLLMITMGKGGLLIISRESDGPMMNVITSQGRALQGKLNVRYYPAIPAKNIINSIGAGDSTVAGFIDGLLRGCSEAECVTLGHKACSAALNCYSAVPAEFVGYPIAGFDDVNTFSKAEYHDISSEIFQCI